MAFAVNKQLKRCFSCKTEKPRTEFYKNRASYDGLVGLCKPCQKVRMTKYVRERSLRDPAFREIRRARSAARNARVSSDPELKREYNEWKRKWYSDHPERVAASYKRYAQANKGKMVAKVSLRRARKYSATPPWADLNAIQEVYSRAAEMNRTMPGFGPFEVDHIIPLAGENVCGLHVAWNLRIVSARENRQKRNRIMEDQIIGTPAETR